MKIKYISEARVRLEDFAEQRGLTLIVRDKSEPDEPKFLAYFKGSPTLGAGISEVDAIHNLVQALRGQALFVDCYGVRKVYSAPAGLFVEFPLRIGTRQPKGVVAPPKSP